MTPMPLDLNLRRKQRPPGLEEFNKLGRVDPLGKGSPLPHREGKK